MGMPTDAALAEAKIWVGSSANRMVPVSVSGDATISAAGVVALAAQIINGADLANVVDANVIGGVQVVHRITIADATANTDVVLTHKTRVIDAYAVKTAADGGAGDQVIVQNGANAISNVISLNAVDKTLVRVGTLDDAQWSIAAGGTLRIAATKATNCACEVVVIGIRTT